MEYQLWDHVRIIGKDVTGRIIDITHGKDDKTYYCVESDTPGYTNDPEAYPGEWPEFDVTADRLEKI